jgi:hypothetical protein
MVGFHVDFSSVFQEKGGKETWLGVFSVNGSKMISLLLFSAATNHSLSIIT